MSGPIRYGLLGVRRAIPVSATGDSEVPLVLQGGNSPRYILRRAILVASGDASGATAGPYTDVGGGGTTLSTAAALATLNASGTFLDMLLARVCAQQILANNPLYFRVTVAGGATTVDLMLFGDEVPA